MWTEAGGPPWKGSEMGRGHGAWEGPFHLLRAEPTPKTSLGKTRLLPPSREVSTGCEHREVNVLGSF